MNLRDAAQLALKALESVEWYGAGSGWMVDADAIEKSITALRTALAEPEHEIIARMRRLRAEAQAEHRRALEQGKCPSCMQPLPEELKTEYQVDQDLRNAAMQRLTDIQQEMERSIDSLKAALAGCDHCNSPLWCGTKCSNCGKVWEWASGIEG